MVRFPITSSGEQPSQPGIGYQDNLSTLAKLGLGSSAVIAGGFITTKSGRVWDNYVRAIRNIEAASPGAVLRTFRLSEFLSPLESWDKVEVSKEVSRGGLYSDYLKTIVGEAKGISLKRTGSVFGEITNESGQVIGYGLQIKAGTQKGTAIADYYARIAGLQLSEHQSLNDALLRAEFRASKTPLSYDEWLRFMEPELKQKRIILGAKLKTKINILGKDFNLSSSLAKTATKFSVVTNLFRAKAASTAGRLNVLLQTPFELPGLKKLAEKLPFLQTMAVKPGTNLEMMGRFVKKGIYASLAWKGLEYADYLRASSSPLAPLMTLGIGAGLGNILARKPGMMFSKSGLLAGAVLGLTAAFAPRFDEGLFYGAATLGTDANVARAELSQATGLTQSLQNQERITPGLTSPATGLAFGAIAAMGIGFHGYGKMLAEAVSIKRPGQTLSAAIDIARQSRRLIGTSKLWEVGIGKRIAETPILKNIAKIKSPMALGFLGGVATWQLLTSSLSILSGNFGAAIPGAGLFGTEETPEELQAIYSGEKEVPVRKGRWWEMSRNALYSGGRIDYYRQHFLPRLRARAYEKGLYGNEEEKFTYDPILHPINALFGPDEWKYHYEQKYAYERPAPISGTYGSDIPFIGPLIAATIGKLIKPRKLIRPEEWINSEGEYAHHPDIRGEEEPAYHLGGLKPGAPVAPGEPTQLLNELNYRRREAVGLVGFMEGALTKAAIGREEFFENKETLAEMGKETGSEYWFWKHLNLAGGLGSTEAYRRFVPRTPSYKEFYNPLKASVPSWYPKDYFLDLEYGNNFSKIPEYEVRGPGSGYAALHPEVEGLSPEEYPLAHRVKILGDLAMYSNEYRHALSMAKRNINRMTQKEANIVLETERQVKEKKKRREFQDYRFRPELLQQETVTVSDVISPRRFTTKEYGDLIIEAQGIGKVADTAKALEFTREQLQGKKVSILTPSMQSRKFSTVTSGTRIKAIPIIGGEDLATKLQEEGLAAKNPYEDEFAQQDYAINEQLAGRISEAVLHNIETPLEYLTPISPSAKLIRQRTAIEEYVKSEAIGTQNSFWDRPVENFFSPAYQLTKYRAGITEIPENIQKRREIAEYYDMLQWVKSSRLEALARQKGDLSEAAEFKKQKQSTVFGMDVFKSPVSIMSALPRRERDFFAEFSEAKTEQEREQILELIPENERRVYLSQWLRQEEAAAYAKREAKIDTEEDNKVINFAAIARKSEGFAYKEGDQERWLKETGGRIEFDDYIRERKAAEYFSTHSLPDSSWLGWSPATDLKDLELVNAELSGIDIHDLDIWDQRKRALARKPYINEELIAQMQRNAEYEDSWKVARNSKALIKMYNDNNAEIRLKQMSKNTGPDKYDITVMDNRQELINKAYKQLGASQW